MTDTPRPEPHPEPEGESFQTVLQSVEGISSSRVIPPPVNPLQAQTAFESRARIEDFVAHAIAIIVVLGFFLLAGLGLLGFVDLNHSTVAAAFGTIVGYAVGKVDPVLTRYFTARAALLQHMAENAAQRAKTAPPASTPTPPPPPPTN